MPEGNCRLCGLYGNLTYEHVPPRSAFNKHTKYKIVPFLDLLKNDDLLNPTINSRTEQGGVGYYSLCSKCNSFLGTRYVNAYTAYSNTFIDIAKRTENNYFDFIMHDFEAGKVIRQIVSMFLAVNPWEFSKNNSSLAAFVLDPNSTLLPSKYRLFLYLNSEGQLRNLPFSFLGDFSSNVMISASEIAFPPVGHVLTIGFGGQIPYFQEITHFKEYPCSERVSLPFQVYRLPTHLPFLMDYRDKETILNQYDHNKGLG